MHAIKDRNGMDLIEAEEIRRGGKNLQKNYTKMVLVTWRTRMVWSHTLSQTSWRMKSTGLYEASLWTKLVEVMKFLLRYFKSQKVMLLKYCTKYASKFVNTALATGLENINFHSSEKGQCQRRLKQLHNCTISHARKVILKILHAMPQEYVNRQFSRCTSWI